MSITLGEAIDTLYSIRETRLSMGRALKEMQAKEAEAKQAVMALLGTCGLAKASGQLATASITTTDVPMVTDWEAVHEYIRINDRFDLLQKRLSAPAWRELFNEGSLVPGTEAAIDNDLSLTKSSRK